MEILVELPFKCPNEQMTATFEIVIRSTFDLTLLLRKASHFNLQSVILGNDTSSVSSIIDNAICVKSQT